MAGSGHCLFVGGGGNGRGFICASSFLMGPPFDECGEIKEKCDIKWCVAGQMVFAHQLVVLADMVEAIRSGAPATWNGTYHHKLEMYSLAIL